jgi:copper chaperone
VTTVVIELTLPDLSCAHCVRTVTEVVQRLDPGARVDADVETRRVRIETSRPPAAIRAALADEGYPAR